MSKKTVMIHSNFCKAFTGFGKNKKNILRYLYNTGKYRIVEFANGQYWEDEATRKTPWECYGSLPPNNVIQSIKDPNEHREMAYGSKTIDKAIQEIKPDVYIGIEDIWAFDGYAQKPWWNKVNCMIWTTLDSLPILQSAIDAAPKIKHYYVWASFAERAMKKLGYDHIKTLRGSLDVNNFYRMNDDMRNHLRSKFGLSNEFIIGFVFRNQLRKSVPNLLDGFKIAKESIPNAKLLLHTHWSEGWNIPALIEEKGINERDILTTYFCKNCREYFIAPFIGQDKNCNCCKSEKSVSTTNIHHGVNEKQLNEIYNLMDVYCHPFTSGGQEIPIQEAKLTELITLVTNYSCGEDYCYEDSGGIPLEWAEYREPGTQFIKASTDPKSIAKELVRVYSMESIERASWGIRARQFVIDNCSIEAIGKQLEDIIDAMPFVDYDFSFDPPLYNLNYTPQMHLDNLEFIIDIHKNFLNEIVDKNSSSVKHWLSEMNKGLAKQHLVEHFKNVALKIQRQKPIEFGDVLDKDDEGKRIAVVIPESNSDVLMINSLIKNLKKQYPSHNIYILTKPNNFEYIEDNIFIHKCIAYSESIDNLFILEGGGNHNGYFDMAFLPHTTTQKSICYTHNGKNKHQFQLQ